MQLLCLKLTMKEKRIVLLSRFAGTENLSWIVVFESHRGIEALNIFSRLFDLIQ